MVFNLQSLIKTLVVDTFTFRLFSTNFSFQVNSLFFTSSRDSVTIAKSSAFRSSQGQPLGKSRENAFIRIKSYKKLKTKHWRTTISTENTLLHAQSTISLLLKLLYVALSSVMIHSGMSITLIAYHITFLGTR